MHTEIYITSGTGNSFWAARELASRLAPDCVKLKPIRRVTSAQVSSAQRIGLVLPVHFLTIPAISSAFLRNFSAPDARYIFAVLTNGGMPGNAINELRRILAAGGLRLDWAQTLVLPDNSIVAHHGSKKKRALLAAAPAAIANFARAINECQMNVQSIRHMRRLALLAPLLRMGLLNFMGCRRKYSTSRCSGCGLCIRLCMSRNISLQAGRATFGAGCTNCFGCAHYCPQRAIRFGRAAITDASQYTHPDVGVEEIVALNRIETA